MLPLISSFTAASSGTAWLLEQRYGRHDLARGAIPALIAVAGHECRLHGMHCFGSAETLDGSDLFPVVHQGQAEAGEHASAVDMHGARAALPVVAAFLRSGQRHCFTNAIQQRCPRIDAERVFFTVDAQM